MDEVPAEVPPVDEGPVEPEKSEEIFAVAEAPPEPLEEPPVPEVPALGEVPEEVPPLEEVAAAEGESEEGEDEKVGIEEEEALELEQLAAVAVATTPALAAPEPIPPAVEQAPPGQSIPAPEPILEPVPVEKEAPKAEAAMAVAQTASRSEPETGAARESAWISGDRIMTARLVSFPNDEISLSPKSFQVMDAVAKVLQENPNVMIRIEGHADDKGRARYNQELSDFRAIMAKRYLVSKGISSRRIRTFGYGESRPIGNPDTPSGRGKNRRIEFVIIAR